MRSKLILAFTLVELLVVIAVITLLLAILLPALSRAKEMGVTAACLSNLRQDSIGMSMYATDFDGILPYPTTKLGENVLWFTAIDPYLEAQANTTRSGVAGDRTYMKFKQCPALAGLLGGGTNYGGTGAQDPIKEYTRSYKMNSSLCRNNPSLGAKIYDVRLPSNFVAIGDGIALDFTGPIPSQYENGLFSMEVNDTSQGNPALRHRGGASIVFVDGHAEREQLLTISKTLRSPQNDITVKSWQGEYLRNGTRYNPPVGATALPAGVTRNPAMPLQWSDVGTLYK